MTSSSDRAASIKPQVSVGNSRRSRAESKSSSRLVSGSATCMRHTSRRPNDEHILEIMILDPVEEVVRYIDESQLVMEALLQRSADILREKGLELGEALVEAMSSRLRFSHLRTFWH